MSACLDALYESDGKAIDFLDIFTGSSYFLPFAKHMGTVCLERVHTRNMGVAPLSITGLCPFRTNFVRPSIGYISADFH